MKIEHLEELVDLAETFNFTRTAKHFYITQPVLSKHIATLEQELGGQLFDRSRQGIQLTPFGEALLPAAKAIIGDKNRLFEEAKRFKAGTSTSIKVGFLQGAAGKHIPEIQKRFKAMHPEVEVSYFTYEFDKIFEALNNSSVDMVIGGLTLSLPEDAFVVKSVYEDAYFALVNADDELTHLQSVRPEDLRGRTVVVPAPSFFSRDIEALTEWLEPNKNNIQLMESVHDINSAPFSVKISNAISLTFGHLAPFYGDEYEFIPVAGFDKVLDIAVIWRRSAEKSFFDGFASVVREVIQSVGY